MSFVKINTGSVVIRQVMLLTLLLPIVILFSFFAIKNLTKDTFGFLIPMYGIVFIIIKNQFSYNDVYLIDNKLSFKKIFLTKEKYSEQIVEVAKGFWPLDFYIIFNDGSKFFFQASIFDLFKGTDNVLKEIKDRIFTHLVTKRSI